MISGMFWSLKESRVAKSNLADLLNLIYASHAACSIIVNSGVRGERIKMVQKKVFLPRQMCFNPGWMGGPDSV